MSRSERLIDLLKLREAMRARRQARAVGELSSEIDRSKTIQEKLLGLIKANTPLDEPMTSFEVYLNWAASAKISVLACSAACLAPMVRMELCWM